MAKLINRMSAAEARAKASDVNLLINRVYEDINGDSIGTVVGFHVDANNVEYAIVALDAAYRLASGQYMSNNSAVTGMTNYNNAGAYGAPETATDNCTDCWNITEDKYRKRPHAREFKPQYPHPCIRDKTRNPGNKCFHKKVFFHIFINALYDIAQFFVVTFVREKFGKFFVKCALFHKHKYHIHNDHAHRCRKFRDRRTDAGYN